MLEFAILCLALTSSSQAVTWTAGGDKTNWFDAANWGGILPQNGDAVIINSGGPVILSNSTPALASFTITNATLMQTNWMTALIATQITVQANGKITHAACDTNTVLSNTNRVFIQCSNLTVTAGGSINADLVGYRGGPAANSYGQGPSHPYDGGGAGYGGAGGRGYYANYPGITYGSSNNPVEPGSGGGGHNLSVGGHGGGAIRIEASGTVALEGTITARGESAGGQGGRGSGGGIYIACWNFVGTNGSILADGGNGTVVAGGGGGGGGGRIAVFYGNSDTFYGSRSVVGGIGGEFVTTGAYGTVYRECTSASPVLAVIGSPADYGTATPYAYGYTAVPTGTSVTDSVPFRINAATGLQRGCAGWRITTNGVETGSGSSTQAFFVMSTEDTTLTWRWTNLYELAVSAAPGGIASTNMNGFYTNGLAVQIAATATGSYSFVQWSGDIPFEDRTNNPVTVVMNGPRSIQANFEDTVGRLRTWSGTGFWTSITNWTPEGTPGSQDSIVVGPGTVTLREPARMASLTLSNGAIMVFTNWTTTLTAGDVTILNNGKITHATCDANAGPFGTNRICIFCSNLTVAAGGSINADWLGYRAATNQFSWGQGPGGGYYQASAGYGGSGGVSAYGGTAGGTYGSYAEPIAPGSGGGCHNPITVSGSGGGAIWLSVSNRAIINGALTANGKSGVGQGSSGSGGAIYLACRTFASTNGVIRVDGGDMGESTYDGAGGGGGRVALIYDATAQSNLNLTATPVVTISASQGYSVHPGYPGTIYLPDHSFFPQPTRLEGGQLLMPTFLSWNVNSLTISNGLAVFPEDMQLTVSNNLTLAGNGAGLLLTNASLNLAGNLNMSCGKYGASYLQSGPASNYRIGGNLSLSPGYLYCYASTTTDTWLCYSNVYLNAGTLSYQDRPTGYSTFQINGNLTLTNAGEFYIYSSRTNNLRNYGTLVTVGGDITLASNSWIYPASNPTNGGSPLFRMRNLSIAQGGGINASDRGLNGAPLSTVYGYGLGGGYQFDGAGYGGVGGKGGYSGGVPGGTYGSSNAPIDPGSGGGAWGGGRGGHGGGLVRIEANNIVTLNGSILANGGTPTFGQAGAGSGGGIYVKCRVFSGNNSGLLQADGGSVGASSQYNGGSGGGGRIAVVRRHDLYQGSASVSNGTAYAGHQGTPGTIVWKEWIPGTFLTIY
jgi:hypothetical protein